MKKASKDQTAGIINELILHEFLDKGGLGSPVTAWKQNNGVLYAQNCQRNIPYGFQKDFKTFPYKQLGEYKTMQGQAAYAYLVLFAAGLEGNVLDTHNRNQFTESYSKVVREHAEAAKKYGYLFDMITHDAELIHNQVTSHFRPKNEASVARDASNQKKGQNILVICGASEKNRLTITTLNLLKATESKQKLQSGHKNYIHVTHPEQEVLEKVKLALEAEKHVLRSGITCVPFSELGVELERSDRVYITTPMGFNVDAEQQIIDAWKNKLRKDSILTHLRGNVEETASIVAPWKDIKLANYLSPQDVRDQTIARDENNKKIIEKAHQASAICAELRSRNVKPTASTLRENDPQIFFDYY